MKITHLKEMVSSLEESERKLFERIFEIGECTSTIVIPEALKRKVKKYGPIDDFTTQKIVRIRNRVSGDETIFNPSRARRYRIESKANKTDDWEKLIEGSKEDCIFCKREVVEDLVGKIERESCYSCGNLFSYDKYNSMIAVKWHNPLLITEQLISDYLDVAKEWWERVYKEDREAKYPCVGWNFGPIAGASEIHSHLHLISTFWPERAMREAFDYSSKYKEIYGSSYWEDISKVHEALGIGFKHKNSKILLNLTPQLDKHFIIIADDVDELKKPIFACVKSYIDRGENFNLTIWVKPFENSWEDFPYVVNIGSKGTISCRVAGGFRESPFARVPIIPTDPFELAERMKEEYFSWAF